MSDAGATEQQQVEEVTVQLDEGLDTMTLEEKEAEITRLQERNKELFKVIGPRVQGLNLLAQRIELLIEELLPKGSTNRANFELRCERSANAIFEPVYAQLEKMGALSGLQVATPDQVPGLAGPNGQPLRSV